jgi:hypothetical protein
MGGGVYSRDTWAATATTRSMLGEREIFKQNVLHKIHASLDPSKIKVRESRDSEDSPQAVPVLLGCDVTGSMGNIAVYLAKEGIGELVGNILDKRPIPHPHIGFCAIGDAIAGDQAPLQVSQFEADNRIDQIVEDLWIEKRGGGNSSESYDLPWYFAANFVESDAWDKRQQKGYCFTYGDEPAPHFKYGTQTLRRVFGERVQGPVKTSQMLAAAQEKWKVFHVIIEQGSRGKSSETKRSWQKLLGPNALFLDDYKALPALIVATMEFAEGKSKEEALNGAGNFRSSVERAFNISEAYSPQGDNYSLGHEESDAWDA